MPRDRRHLAQGIVGHPWLHALYDPQAAVAADCAALSQGIDMFGHADIHGSPPA